MSIPAWARTTAAIVVSAAAGGFTVGSFQTASASKSEEASRKADAATEATSKLEPRVTKLENRFDVQDERHRQVVEALAELKRGRDEDRKTLQEILARLPR